MSNKKIAVMIYPYFSMQEISMLTDGLKVFYDIDIEVIASTKSIICSEDNFQIIAHKTFDEVDLNEIDALILPGIYNPLPALFDENNIQFLKEIKAKRQTKDILIASISSSPLLLGKAGLLENVRYTCGAFEQIVEKMEFMDEKNFIHQPIIEDQKIITAMGFAYKELAIKVIQTLGIDDCKEGLFNGVAREYTEDELTFFMSEEHFKEFMDEYEGYLK